MKNYNGNYRTATENLFTTVDIHHRIGTKQYKANLLLHIYTWQCKLSYMSSEAIPGTSQKSVE